jgi:hypothetical protein
MVNNRSYKNKKQKQIKIKTKTKQIKTKKNKKQKTNKKSFLASIFIVEMGLRDKGLYYVKINVNCTTYS